MFAGYVTGGLGSKAMSGIPMFKNQFMGSTLMGGIEINKRVFNRSYASAFGATTAAKAGGKLLITETLSLTEDFKFFDFSFGIHDSK